MESKFEGFERCFNMTINNTSSLQYLRNTNDRRKQLDIKIAKGTAITLDMMIQLKAELLLFDVLYKNIERKKKAKKCCSMINIVISTLSDRINHMWNTSILLFDIDDEIEAEFINMSKRIIKTSCTNCRSCDIPINSIARKIKIISIQEDVIFKLSSSDFMKIRQSTAFIDKTLMIKEVFCNKVTKGTVITAPRKYGKSTNLSMLKYFLEIQVDSLGKPLTKANANKPITDTSNYEIFKGLNISKETDIMDKHFGQYPVLYLNFKIEKSIKSYVCVLDGCKEIIHKSFQLHSYLQNSSKLSTQQRKECKCWCDDASYKTIKKKDDILFGLQLLCTFLTDHYEKKCIVLIDDIDFFTQIVSTTETLFKDYKLIILILKEFLSFLKDNKFVITTFATGKSGYAIYSIMPICFQIHPFYNFHNYTDYYGLTENELKYLFNKSEFKNVSVTINEVKAYYGSYNKVDEDTTDKKKIYCIWSILNVLKYKRVDNYWRDFGNIFCNFENPTIKKIMQKLLIKGQVMVVLNNKEGRKTHPTPPPIISVSEAPIKNSLDYYFNLMLDLGYFTCNSTSLVLLDLENNTGSCVGYVTIPNQEVRHDIKDKISLLSLSS
ncbi:hypothetical protein QTP88_006999 [Uroleucon formosanum]